jgi:hypothetical protein
MRKNLDESRPIPGQCAGLFLTAILANISSRQESPGGLLPTPIGLPRTAGKPKRVGTIL